jgi:serine/threonine-protein kinase
VQPVDDRGREVEKLLAGRYEMVGFLGRGGFASVYQVKSASLQRFEALKVLLEAHGEDSEFARRFRQEARVAASLEHPGIVKIYDFGHVESTLWYSMQFVDGPTLKGDLVSRGTFDEESAARIAVPLLDALDYSHARGIVHRDIKPDNVLLDRNGRPFLMDFGIAKTGDTLVKTQTGFILGSPAYLSPEQLRGQRLDGRTDVYSLGVMLYQMLAGVTPYRSESMSALEQRIREDAPPLTEKCPGITAELARIVHRALARDRDARYKGAAEMREDLEAFLAEAHPRAPRVRTASTEHPSLEITVPVPVSTAPSPSRRPAWLWPAAGALAVALVAAAVLLTRTSDRRVGPVETPTQAPAATRTVSSAPTPDVAPAETAPLAAPTPLPESRATPVPPAPTAPREAAPRPASRAAARPRPAEDAPVTRRAKTPPDIEEDVALTLSPDEERECGGKVVGISVVIGDDGGLRTRRVISPASSKCDALALAAISRYRFRPARDEAGRPVEGRFVLSFRF